MGSHSLLQGAFPAQGWSLGLLHCREVLYVRDTGEPPPTPVLPSNVPSPVTLTEELLLSPSGL